MSDLDPEVLDRRHMLIAALKSGTYRQGWKSLMRQDLNYDNDENGYPARHVVPKSQRLCCLGVGMAIAEDNWLDRGIKSKLLEFDATDDYEKVVAYYDISPKLMNYLMGMNDGDIVQHPDKAIEVAHTPYMANSPVYHVKMSIRKSQTSRDFKFIARFLEIVWGLK